MIKIEDQHLTPPQIGSMLPLSGAAQWGMGGAVSVDDYGITLDELPGLTTEIYNWEKWYEAPLVLLLLYEMRGSFCELLLSHPLRADCDNL